MIGAEAYLAANVGSGTPTEFRDWVSYCNELRAPKIWRTSARPNGDKEPFRVKYWDVGNEPWGCGDDSQAGSRGA